MKATPLSKNDLLAAGFVLERRALRHSTALMLVDQSRPEYDPLVVDFLSGPLLYRLKNGLSKTQPMGKALGLKSFRAGEGPSVLDATAGMGTDAFIMSAMGCRVRAIEQSPVIFRLLQDGHERLRLATLAETLPETLPETRDEAVRNSPNTQAHLSINAMKAMREIAGRLSFENAVSHEVLKNLAQGGLESFPDVIYLDPMYPEEGRSKSALPKKEMQIFRRLLGQDLDTEELLELALSVARARVVVKRPLSAPALGGRVTHSFEGKTARFDMYLAKR